MDNNAFSFYSNVFGVFIGVTTILSVLLGFCRSHLPSQRIKELEDLFEETKGLYESAVEDGLLPDGMLRSQMEDRLANLRDDTLRLRSRAYSATTLLKDYQEFFRGLSYAIAVACFHVKEIRASVITTSEAERRKTGVCGGDCRTVPRSSSPTPPQISCAMEMRFVPSIESHEPDHSHPRHIMTHADAPRSPCGLHDVEVDLTDLRNHCDYAFLGRRPLLDGASIFSDDSVTSSDDNPAMEYKALPGAQDVSLQSQYLAQHIVSAD